MSKKALPRFKKQTSLDDYWRKGPGSTKRPVEEDISSDTKSLNKKQKQDSEPIAIVTALESDSSSEDKMSYQGGKFPGDGHALGKTSPSRLSNDWDSPGGGGGARQFDDSIENGAFDESFADDAHSTSDSNSPITVASMCSNIADLPRTPACLNGIPSDDLPSARDTNNAHQRLAMGPESTPFPPELNDIWNPDHVKMPYSKQNLYMTDSKSRKVSRWKLIKEALCEPITNFDELKKAILHYNSLNQDKWDFDGLQYFIEDFKANDRRKFFTEVLPFMKKLVLESERIITEPPRLLKKDRAMSVTMSQNQAACLLANAFFCTFPYRSRRKEEYAKFPEMNFVNLFDPSNQDRKLEKLKCLFFYFQARCKPEANNSCITFRRQLVKNSIDWKFSGFHLTRLHVSASGNIERDGEGMLQVDFANKYVGGGVLGRGLVQEEIRFIICPEMIVSRLLTEELNENECLIMTGCQRYSNSQGYSDSFECLGPYEDKTARDANGQLLTEVVAIDALVSKSYMEQFTPRHLKRELNKAYCGFMNPLIPDEHKSAVATGNWGCGAFGGDVYVKALTQLMSAAAAKRDVCYFTFQDSRLMKALQEMHTFLCENKVSVGELFRYLIAFHTKNRDSYVKKGDLFKFIHQKVSNEDDSDSDHSPIYHENTP